MSARDTKIIKSAQRALQILEFFDSEHPQSTVMEIARILGYPQSSTSELLRCLVGLGYLDYDRYKRVYEPTARVPLLGAWVQPGLFRCGRLLPMLDEIARSTGQTVTLSSVVGLQVNQIHVIQGRSEGSPNIAAGTCRSLLHSSSGRLFMSSYLEKRVRQILHRLNAEESALNRHVRLENLLVELKAIRQQGFAAEYGEFDTGFGAINLLLSHQNGQTLAVGIAGQAHVVQPLARDYVAIMRAAMKPVARPAANMDIVDSALAAAGPEQRIYATA